MPGRWRSGFEGKEGRSDRGDRLWGGQPLFSESSLAAIGQEAVVTRDQEELDRADHILLPGVGPSATQ